MQKISPFLWFDNNAEDAARFYVSLFPNSKMGKIARYPEGSPGPTGTVMSVGFELNGQEFGMVNGGPMFKMNPSISFMVECETMEQIDALWAKLSDGGEVRMPYQAWPFSKKYGWVSDRFGVNWQLSLVEMPLNISPCLMFVKKNAGRAEEAINFYSSVFKDSHTDLVARYGEGDMDKVGFIKHAAFTLAGESFKTMDSSGPHEFNFNEAVSLLVNCDTQEEIDYFWDKLAEGGETSQCGWLKDKFGVSWQVAPRDIDDIFSTDDPAKAKRAMAAMLKMTKFDIAEMRRAADGK